MSSLSPGCPACRCGHLAIFPAQRPKTLTECSDARLAVGIAFGNRLMTLTVAQAGLARAANGHAAVPPSTVMKSRRLVCRESSILRGDGGRFTTPPPSRLEARSRLGF